MSQHELQELYNRTEKLLNVRFDWITMLHELSNRVEKDIHVLLKEQRKLAKWVPRQGKEHV